MKKLVLKSTFLLVILLCGSINYLKAFTAVTSGAWSSAATWGGVGPGSSVSGQDIIIPAGITVTLDMSTSFNGLVNTFTVDGELSSSTGPQLTIVQGSLAGTGTINIQRLSFGTLATSSFTGDLTLNALENSSSLLSLTANTTVSDTLNLQAGVLSLATGANLEMLTGGIIRRNTGSMSISGGIFNSSNSYSLLYVGASKNSGPEAASNSIEHVFLQLNSNADILSLTSDLKVNNTLDMSSGLLATAGYELELNGDLIMASGTMFQCAGPSNITVQTSMTLSSGFVFDPGSSLNIFTIDHMAGGTVLLNSDVLVSNELRLNNGTLSLESGSSLEIGSGALIKIEDGDLVGNGGAFLGTSTYNVAFNGATHTTGLEFTGSGLNDVTVNMNTPDDEIHFGGNVIINGHLELKEGLFHLEGYDLTLNGTVDQEAGSNFKGDVSSELQLNLTLTGNDTIWFLDTYKTIDKLTLNLTGTGDIVLGASLTIANELDLTNGRIDISNYDVIIENPGIITNYDDTQYIVTSGSGRLHQYILAGAAYKVYPIGTATNYSPCSIHQDISASSGYFMANCFNGVLDHGATGANVALYEPVVDRTWRIESETGLGYDMNLKLAWQAASEVNGFDQDDCYISHYSAGWDSYGSASAVAGLHNTMEIERTSISTLSPFAVTDASSNLAIQKPGDQAALEAYPNPTTGIIMVNPSGNANDYTYAAVDMAGRTIHLAITGSNQLDVSDLNAGTYILVLTNSVTGEISRTEFVKK